MRSDRVEAASRLVAEKISDIGCSTREFAELTQMSESTLRILLSRSRPTSVTPHKRGPRLKTYETMLNSEIWTPEERETLSAAMRFMEHVGEQPETVREWTADGKLRYRTKKSRLEKTSCAENAQKECQDSADPDAASSSRPPSEGERSKEMTKTRTLTRTRDGRIIGETEITEYDNGATKEVEKTVRSPGFAGPSMKPVEVTRTDPAGNSRTEKI